MQATTYSYWAIREADKAIEQAAVVDDDTLSPIMAQDNCEAGEAMAALLGKMATWTDAEIAERAKFVRRVAANAECLFGRVIDPEESST